MPVLTTTAKSCDTPVANVSPVDALGTPYQHRIETELLTGTPRRARLTPQTLAIRRWFWNLLVGSFCLMVFLAQRDMRSWKALAERGIMTEAHVSGRHSSTNKGNTHYYLDYAFDTRDAGMAYGKMRVDHSYYLRAQDNDIATMVTYLPGSEGEIWQEGTVTPERQADRQRSWIIGTLCVVGVWGAILAGCESEWKRQLWLLQNGVATTGRVIEGKFTRGSKGEPYYSLLYRYSEPGGTVDRSISVSQSLYERYTQGNPHFTLLYDPNTRNHARPYFAFGSVRLDSLSV